jgi:hypothetical protein
MTYCIDFFRKFKKDGNFCGLDKTQVSRLTAYLEIVELLMKQKIPEEEVYKNFSVSAATPLIAAKGNAHTEGMNYVTAQLKEGKTVTNGDIQTTLKSCSTTTSKPVSIPKTEEKPKSGKTEKPPMGQEQPPVPVWPVGGCSIWRDLAFCIPKVPVTLHPSLGQVMAAGQEPEERTSPPAPEPVPVIQETPPPRPPTPAPCTLLKGCPDFKNHIKTEKIRGRVCDVIGIPCNQLPGPDKECPLERKERLKGTPPAAFVRAGELIEEIAGAKIIKPPAYKISKSRLPDSERDTLTDTLIEHTGFTAKDIEQIDELVKVNREGWTCRFDLVEAAVMMLLAKAEGS